MYCLRSFLESSNSLFATTKKSVPKTVFPGGVLVGCEAGYLNVSRIKGSHAAIKTGMLAADAAFEAITSGRQHDLKINNQIDGIYRKVAEQTGTPYIQLTEGFRALPDKSAYFFRFDGHPNIRGQAEMGKEVGEQLLKMPVWK